MAEKVYCTRCGREIKDGLLYCDRCGQSVKKSRERQAPKNGNRAQAERIHREQIERAKRRKEKEFKKQQNRRKATRRVRILAVATGVLVLAVICAAAAYISMSKNSAIISNDDIIKEDIAKSSPAATTSVVTSSSGSSTTDMSFKLFEYNGISCPYPVSFTASPSSGKELMRLNDTAGGAVMVIAQDAAASAESAARDLMTQYYDEISSLGHVSENRCGSNWYIVTYNAGGITHHRKCVISGAAQLYYDFEYEDSSHMAADYARYIEKLDENFNAAEGSRQ